jgi:succinate dehydrogenase / fumarate reductase flavoprotein subunit
VVDEQNTPMPGFYAAGEAACISVHGANRLGTNSLLDASVFGRRTGYAMARFVQSGAPLQPVTGDPAERNRQRVKHLLDNSGTELVEHIAQDLKTTMTNNCGIFRDEARLQQAMSEIKALQARFMNARTMDKSSHFNTDVLATLEADHMLTFSEVIVAGALVRQESRGAHSRTDFPKRDDEKWLVHTVAHKNGADGPRLSYKPVTIDYDKYPPQERKY